MSGTKAGAAKRLRCPSCGRLMGSIHDCSTGGRAGPKPRPLMERLWAKVDRRGPDECWPWTGHRQRGGYGVIDKQTVARILLGLPPVQRGKPPAEEARHVVCDNPPCCNPTHLARGTRRDNVNDMLSHDRSRRGRRHWNVRLTEGQVSAIRKDTRPSAVIAAEAHVTARHVRRIRQGLKWKVR